MLNDWGIRHFHLGLKLESDGFVERTGPVLFARVAEDKVYFIDVKEHGKGYRNVRTSREIIHRNWPESLAKYKSGFIRMSHEYTEEEHMELRAAGITVPLQMSDGTIYNPPGDGYMSDGTSINVVITHNENARYLRLRQEALVKNISVISADISRITDYRGNSFEFKLQVAGENFVAVEKNSQARLELFRILDFTKDAT